MRPVYLDYNATTPIAPEVAEAMKPCITGLFGNPSSSHIYGREAREAIDRARTQVAGMLGCDTREVIFTSGGTESNNYAIKGAVMTGRNRTRHVITSAVEHPAVTEVCRWLESQGVEITTLPVDEYGLVDPEDLRRSIRDVTVLVTVMHANNEVGTIEPIDELASLAREHGILTHTDAAQSVGKVPVNVDLLGVDLLSVAGHKLYAPKGIGALYIRGGKIPLENILHGAGHEGGRRPGTENIIEIVGLGEACRLAGETLESNMAHFTMLSRRLQNGFLSRFGDRAVRRNGHPDRCLPNTVSLSFRGIDAGELLRRVEDRVAASAGAACHSGEITLSPVLEAMRVPSEWAMGTIRFSVGRSTTEEEIDLAMDQVAAEVTRMTGH